MDAHGGQSPLIKKGRGQSPLKHIGQSPLNDLS